MKARARNVMSIEQVVRTHPGLNDKQKEELITNYRNFADSVCAEAARKTNWHFAREMCSLTLLTLHNDFGYGPDRLSRFAEKFTECGLKLKELIEGTDISAPEASYHDLKSLYPQCDEWLAFEDLKYGYNEGEEDD